VAQVNAELASFTRSTVTEILKYQDRLQRGTIIAQVDQHCTVF
jgi:hypothetical protein